MISCTFYLKRGKLDYGRQKTFVGDNTKECYKKFLSEYSEALDQLHTVYVLGGVHGGTYTADQFKSQISSKLFSND